MIQTDVKIISNDKVYLNIEAFEKDYHSIGDLLKRPNY